MPTPAILFGTTPPTNPPNATCDLPLYINTATNSMWYYTGLVWVALSTSTNTGTNPSTTLYVDAPLLGNGTAGSPLRLSSSVVTTEGAAGVGELLVISNSAGGPTYSWKPAPATATTSASVDLIVGLYKAYTYNVPVMTPQYFNPSVDSRSTANIRYDTTENQLKVVTTGTYALDLLGYAELTYGGDTAQTSGFVNIINNTTNDILSTVPFTLAVTPSISEVRTNLSSTVHVNLIAGQDISLTHVIASAPSPSTMLPLSFSLELRVTKL